MDKYFAIPYLDFYYLVHVPTGKSQDENEIEITEEEYNTLLENNQKHGHMVRCRKKPDGSIEVFSCIEESPSNYHVWSVDLGDWVVDEDKLKEELQLEKEAHKQNLLQQIQDLDLQIQEHLLFDEKEEAKELVLQKRKLQEEINELESQINS